MSLRSTSVGTGGGGFTLRIGRPEFTEFDNITSDKFAAKARAADLLGHALEPQRRLRPPFGPAAHGSTIFQ